MARYEVIGPDGQRGTIDASEAEQARKAGWRVAASPVAEADATRRPRFGERQPQVDQGQYARDFANLLASTLPVVGGGAGALIGGPAGAFLGGAGGEALRQNLQRAIAGPDWMNVGPQTPGEALSRIGQEGGWSLAQELGGRALAGAARGTGRALERSSIKLPEAYAKEIGAMGGDRLIGEENVGRALDVMEKYRVPVGRNPAKAALGMNPETGSRTAFRMRERSAARAAQMLDDARTRGARITADELVPYFKQLVDDMNPTRSAASRADRNEIKGMMVQFIKERSTPSLKTVTRSKLVSPSGQQIASTITRKPRTYLEIDPSGADQIKRDLQKMAEGYYKTKAGKGYVVDAARGNAERFSEAGARGMREVLDQKIPGLNEQNAATQELIGLQNLISHAEIVPTSAFGNIPYIVLRNTIANPAITSRAGLALTNPALSPWLRQAPRLPALLAAMAAEQANQQPEPVGP